MIWTRLGRQIEALEAAEERVIWMLIRYVELSRLVMVKNARKKIGDTARSENIYMVWCENEEMHPCLAEMS